MYSKSGEYDRVVHKGIYRGVAFKNYHRTGFPLGLENLEKWEGIFQSGKSQGILTRLEKSGKITQNTGKMREFQTNIICYSSVTAKLMYILLAKFYNVFS